MDGAMDPGKPRMVATAVALQDKGDATQSVDNNSPDNAIYPPGVGKGPSIFKEVQWSPDGTSVLTSSEDRTLRTFILPPELLEGSSPHTLQPYSDHQCPSPVYATSIHPSFSLSDPSSAFYIASPASLPIRLLSPFSPSIIASYPLIHAPTESYVTPHSLLFSSVNANQFIAGSDSLLSIFDISRPSEDPIVSLRTIPSKRKLQVGGGIGMKGIVSALALNPDGVLAAGTFTRWLGLYDSGGAGDTLAVFPLSSPLEKEGTQDQGVTSLHWSSCGRYLAVAERGSTGIGVWDIRGTGRRLARLQGRKAASMQRLGVAVRAVRSNKDLLLNEDAPAVEEELSRETGGDELWTGNTDGYVRVWSGLGMKEGNIPPTWSFKAHADAIGGLHLHPWGDVLATCSGSRHYIERETGSDESAEDYKHTVESYDCSLRIWAL